MAENLFQANTYESFMPECVEDLSPLELDALQSQIRYFGQCPVQIFCSNAQGLGHAQKHVRTLNLMPERGLIEEKQGAGSSPAFEELKQQYVMSQLEIERLNKEIQDISA